MTELKLDATIDEKDFGSQDVAVQDHEYLKDLARGFIRPRVLHRLHSQSVSPRFGFLMISILLVQPVNQSKAPHVPSPLQPDPPKP